MNELTKPCAFCSFPVGLCRCSWRSILLRAALLARSRAWFERQAQSVKGVP